MDINKICIHCMNETEGTNGRPCPKCGHILGQAREVTHQLKPYTILQGKYLVGDVLGEGGFGITYIGLDLNLEMKVAIKEFYPNGYATRESASTSHLTVYTGQNAEAVYKWRENFLKEARSLGKCSHLAGVVGVRDFFQENNTAYIVLEYLEGMTLKNYAKSLGGRIAAQSLLPALEPVMVALGEVHRQGLIHRDISPDNIMLLPGGQMKLLDFGAARDYTAGGEKSLSVMLKPGYAPEEQYRSKGRQGPWSDIYAFAGTIYKCLTGVTPPEAMERMRNDELRRPNELGAGLTAVQEEALLKAMSVFAEGRYQTMEEFRSALYGQTGGAGAAGAAGMPAGRPGEAQGQSIGGGYSQTVAGQAMTGQPGAGVPQGAYTSQPVQVETAQGGQTSGNGDIQAPGQNKSGFQELIKRFTGDYRSILVGVAAGLAVICVAVLLMKAFGGNGREDSAQMVSNAGGQPEMDVSETEREDVPEGVKLSEPEPTAQPDPMEDTVDIETVLAAYQEYFEENYYEGACELIYLNEDDIPEYVYGYGDTGYGILWYKDGKVVDWAHELISGYGYGTRNVAYQERGGKVLVQTKYGNTIVAEVYEFSEDNLNRPNRIGYMEYGALESYLAYLDGFGTFTVSKTESSADVWKAYTALQEMESLPAYDSEDSTMRFIFGIYDNVQEDYQRSADVQSLYGGYNSGISDFSFCYPLYIYNNVSYDANPVENVYGMNAQTIHFTGTAGSELLFSLTRRTDNDTIAGMTEYIYETEFQSLRETVELVNSASEDHGRVIVTGYTSARDRLVYDLVKIDPQYIMQMVVTFPAYTGEEDKDLKGYTTECIYRMCGFSGNTQEVRSYEEYCAAVGGAN